MKFCLKEWGKSYAESWMQVYDQLKKVFKDYENKYPRGVGLEPRRILMTMLLLLANKIHDQVRANWMRFTGYIFMY